MELHGFHHIPQNQGVPLSLSLHFAGKVDFGANRPKILQNPLDRFGQILSKSVHTPGALDRSVGDRPTDLSKARINFPTILDPAIPSGALAGGPGKHAYGQGQNSDNFLVQQGRFGRA